MITINYLDFANREPITSASHSAVPHKGDFIKLPGSRIREVDSVEWDETYSHEVVNVYLRRSV